MSTEQVLWASARGDTIEAIEESSGLVFFSKVSYGSEIVESLEVPRSAIPALIRFLAGPDSEVINRAEIEALREVAEWAADVRGHLVVLEQPAQQLEYALDDLNRIRAAERKERA